jgi:acetyl esterase/lipase
MPRPRRALLSAAVALGLTGAALAEPMVHRDLPYAEWSERNRLDLYLPEGRQAPPVVVVIHGGGFRIGDKSGFDGTGPAGLGALLDAGLAVAAINYRYSSEAIWPAQLDDLRAAIAFVRDGGESYGYDGARIGVLGGSAGGHLAGWAALDLAADPATRLHAAVVQFPPVEFATMDADIEATGVSRRTGRNDAPDSAESALIGAPVAQAPALAEAASPLAALRALPPGTPLPAMLLMHGTEDAFIGRGQSGRLFAALLAHPGVGALEFVLLPDAGHGDGAFRDPANEARVAAFLARHLGGAS